MYGLSLHQQKRVADMSDHQFQKKLFFSAGNVQQRTLPEKNFVFHLVLAICLLLLLASCSDRQAASSVSVTTPTAVPSPTATQPAVPAGTILYHTDWSQGLSGWNTPAGISAQGSKGLLHLTCKSFAILTLQYQPTVANYAIEVPIQIVSTQSNAGTFTFNTQQSAGKDGYTVGAAVLETLPPFHGEVEANINPISNGSPAYAADFSPDNQWITYRVDIQDNTATLSINGARHGQVLSNQTDNLSNGPLTFNCADIVLNVKPLTITAL